MRKILAITIAFMPFNSLRIFFYRFLLGYEISYKCRIKGFNLLLCNKMKMEGNAKIEGRGNVILDINEVVISAGATIGKLNRFRSFNKLFMGSDVIVRSQNAFFGTFDNISPFKEFENILIGNKSIITSKHIFDLSDEVIIGEDVTFGGSGSQIWTHGFDLEHTKIQSGIKIGNRCYIGTRALLMPGNNICDDVSIAGGCVVSRPISEPGFYVSSQLIRKSDCPSFKSNKNVRSKAGFYFYRKENSNKI